MKTTFSMDLKKLSSILLCLIVFSTFAVDIQTKHNRYYELLGDGKYVLAINEAKLLLENADLSDEQISATHYIIGYGYRKLNNFSASLLHYEKAIAASNNDDLKAKMLNNISACLMYMNLYEQSIKESEKASLLSNIWKAVSLYNKALAEIQISNYADAQLSLEEAIKHCRKVKNEAYETRLWNQVGLLEMDLYEMSSNEKHAKNALQHFMHTVDIQDNLKMSLSSYSENDRYLIDLERGKANHYMANLNLLTGDSTAAKHYFEKAIAIQKNSQYKFHALKDYAAFLNDVNEKELAKSLADTALSIFPSITLTGETIKIFFLAQKLSIDTPSFFEKFSDYVEERERMEKTYATYIGRQIMREKALHAQKQRQFIALTILLGLLLVIAMWFAYKHYRRNQSQKSIKKILNP